MTELAERVLRTHIYGCTVFTLRFVSCFLVGKEKNYEWPVMELTIYEERIEHAHL